MQWFDINLLTKDKTMFIDKIKALVAEKFGQEFGYTYVGERKGSLGSNYIDILVSPSTIQINKVRLQYPDLLGLILDVDTMELSVSNLGGTAGQVIYLKPTTIYTAYDIAKVPFRKPKPQESNILKAIEKYFDNYLTLLQQNKENLAHWKFYTEDARVKIGLPLYSIDEYKETIKVYGVNRILTYLSLVNAQPKDKDMNDALFLSFPVSWKDKIVKDIEFFLSV